MPLELQAVFRKMPSLWAERAFRRGHLMKRASEGVTSDTQRIPSLQFNMRMVALKNAVWVFNWREGRESLGGGTCAEEGSFKQDIEQRAVVHA